MNKSIQNDNAISSEAKIFVSKVDAITNLYRNIKGDQVNNQIRLEQVTELVAYTFRGIDSNKTMFMCYIKDDHVHFNDQLCGTVINFKWKINKSLDEQKPSCIDILYTLLFENIV